MIICDICKDTTDHNKRVFKALFYHKDSYYGDKKIPLKIDICENCITEIVDQEKYQEWIQQFEGGSEECQKEE